jgi:hypothetical protein
MRRRLLIFFGAAVAAGLPGLLFGQRNGSGIDFNRRIRPVLSDTCFACHGPDEQHRMAGLRLDEKESALRVIVPGRRDQSKLWARISHPDAKLRMPPPGFERSLSKEQVEAIGRWIDEGAEWQTHWAYAPPRKPALPAVAAKRWPRNGIDHFVLARLEKEGLKPSPQADKTTLIRRVSLDLTGLPPTPEEVSAFLADRSPDAYETVVDRLLSSPHYGERMALMWLDLARYADTHGYHIDSHRDMWPWRDWVTGAFNRNMPFDRFTIEQIAGDLQEKPTQSQILATGFQRNHMINYEGGAIADEYLVEYVVDRVETTATVWMGMTMGCARCHDHKYDPISQRDFYRFFAFFNNIDEKGLDGREGNAKPVLPLPDAGQKAKLEEVEAALKMLDAALPEKEIALAQAEWEKNAELTAGPAGALAHFALDGDLRDLSGHYRFPRLVAGNPAYSSGPAGQSIVFDGETHVEWGMFGESGAGRPFSAAFWLRPNNKLEMGLLDRYDPVEKRGVWLRLEEGGAIGNLKRGARLIARIAHRYPEDALEVITKLPVVQSEFTHIALVYDGAARAGGIAIYFNGRKVETETLRDKLSGAADAKVPWSTGNKRVDKPARAQFDDVRFYQRALTAPEVGRLAEEAIARGILETPADKRTKEQKERLRDYYLTYKAETAWGAAYGEWKRRRKEKEQLDKEVLTSMVMEELKKPRDTYILGRGDYRNRTEKVTPAVPASLPPLPAGAPSNRLGLAEWLVSREHPLTARVAVNRFWQMVFGAGLVETSEDFGSQGSPPSHPELLDWLATEFSSGWDVKAMMRLIVTSSVYRQSAKATPELTERDPHNRLLARMSRFRLPAELVRDNALAAAGLLNREIGGPSVYPYHPRGVWEEVAYGDVFSAQTYAQGTGKDLYRRSMYTFWKRTVPPAAMSVFDAPDREKCVSRRPRTNTPLQALALMNDPTFVEAARAVAAKAMKQPGGGAAAIARSAFRRVAAREPSAAETRLLVKLAETSKAQFKRDPEAARRLGNVGESKPAAGLDTVELAAWTTVASAILNLDEVITKE